MGYQLLTLHRVKVPDAANAIYLGGCKHVSLILIGAPVEARDWCRVGAADPPERVLLDVPEQLGLLLRNHPNLDTLPRGCH